jgi:hypothetical protein
MLSSSRERLIKLVRRSQTYISIFIFITVFFVCWKFANLDIREIELSNWGKSGWIGRIWNSAVCLFAVSIFVNSFLYLKNHTRIKYKKKFYYLFGFLSICLFGVGFFNLDHKIIHNVSAGLYFFLYPLTIFIFAYLNRNYMMYSDWLQKVILSTSMAVFPMMFIHMFPGMAIAEIAHTFLVILYNIKIARHE